MEENLYNFLSNASIIVNNSSDKGKIIFITDKSGVHYTINRMSGYIDIHRYDPNFNNPYDTLFRIRETDLEKILIQFDYFFQHLMIKHFFSEKITYTELTHSEWYVIPLDKLSFNDDSVIIQKKEKVKFKKTFLESDFSEYYLPIQDILKHEANSFMLFSESLKLLGNLIKDPQNSNEFYYFKIDSLKNFYRECLSLLVDIIDRNEIKNKVKLKRLLNKISKEFDTI